MPLRIRKSAQCLHVISPHLKKTSQITRIIGHIHDALTKVVDGMMPEWKDLQVTDKVDVKKRVPPGTGIPHIYFLHRAKLIY